MDRGLSRLFHLMSVSWVFIGTGCEKAGERTDPSDEVDKMVIEEVLGGATETAFD